MTAAGLIAELRRRGVELAPAGSRLRFRPAGAVPPELLAELRQHKAAVLALLTASTPGNPAAAPRGRTLPGAMAYRHPWPATLPGLGPHGVGPFELCVARRGCSTWTWVRYGRTPACYTCARALADTGREP